MRNSLESVTSSLFPFLTCCSSVGPQDCHDQILFPLLRLIASALELPDEETLVRMFTYDEAGECQYRWMFYGTRSPEDNAKLENLYGGAHRDIDILTFHFRQPCVSFHPRSHPVNAGGLGLQPCRFLSWTAAGVG